MKLGLDIGSKNIGYAILDGDAIIDKGSVAHNGDIPKCFGELTGRLQKKYNSLKKFGVTGKLDSSEVRAIDTILASVEANRFLKTGCRNILSIGCESFYLVLLDKDYFYLEHTVNSDCASGTGSFIDQQAERLGFTSEELAGRAFKFSGKVPSIATRCAVFAKSDIIHAQAQGYSKDAIAAGICEGVARNILANTVKGREMSGGILVVGGVSANRKIISEIEIMTKARALVTETSFCFNAVGAAVIGTEPIEKLSRVIRTGDKKRELRNELRITLTSYPDFSQDKTAVEDGIEITRYVPLDKSAYSVYLGIDIGSTSTKAVVTDRDMNVLLGLYTKTKGDPVNAVKELFSKIKKAFQGKDMGFLGVGTTGSGRELIRSVIGADISVNEITAHARAAAHLDPEVDTIIEIGGQDSKFTLLSNGSVTAAAMNYVCAAGTGSFIEEQAARLGITLDEISGMALGQKAPFTSDRCTVYMERDLNTFLAEGWNKKEIIASVLYSVRDNYLSKVVGKSPLGKKIYFQGATARNKALVAVFEEEIKKPILVSRYCHLTGALGTAVYMKEKGIDRSAVSGIDLNYTVESEICTLCANRCDMKVYTVEGKKSAWGLKCGREYEDKKVGIIRQGSELERKFHRIFTPKDISDRQARTVGIPVTLYLQEYLPLFQGLFRRLGFNVVLEKGSASKMKQGMELINSDFCAPMVLAHGIAKSLLERNVDLIFFPALINEQSYVEKLPEEEKFMDKSGDAYFCYYSEYAPTIVGNLWTLDFGDKLLSPRIKFNNRPIEKTAGEISDYLSEKLSLDKQTIADAFMESYREFQDKRKEWALEGAKLLSQNEDRIKLLMLGRPYSVFDREINLGIPAKLESMGFELFYQSMADIQYEKKKENLTLFDRMHWYYGQQILFAADLLSKRKDFYPVFLSCFRCSPDSYLITYFKEMMSKIGKPYLIIQLDEHSSDVGYQTRIEAAVETFRNDFASGKKAVKPYVPKPDRNDPITQNDTVLISFLSPIISELQRSAFEAHGYAARVLPLEEKTINTGYRFASGGECMPNVAIIGSLIETIRREDIDPQKAVFYLPSICMGCNFNQFSTLADIACASAGISGLKISNSNAARSLPELPKEANVSLMSVNILGSLLYKLYYRYHPYEVEKGAAKKALDLSFETVKNALREGRSLFSAAEETRAIFETVPVDGERKPRVGILGDLYVKFNAVLNNDIYSLIEELGGEVLLPAFTDTVVNLIDADVRENGLSRKFLMGFTYFEKKFEMIFKDMKNGALEGSFEPPVEECVALMKDFGVEHYIAGETAINVGRMLYYIKHELVSAVAHLNPIFCCPGVVSASLFRKIQKEFNVPIIDLFYDGTNRPNRMIIPHMATLGKTRAIS